MAKAGELDWTDLTTRNDVVKSTKNDVKNANKGGDKVTKAQLRAEAEFLMKGFQAPGIRQATDEELFGHLVVTEEQVAAAEDDWNNKFSNFYKEANKPVDNKVQDWGNGKMIDWDSMTEEERLQRNMSVDGGGPDDY